MKKNTKLQSAIFESSIFNQRKIAGVLKIGESVMSCVVNGHRQATPRQQEIIANLLNCEIEDIFGEGE